MIEHVVTGSENAVLSNDERSIAITLMTATGRLGRLRFALDDVPTLIAHLCGIVGAVLLDPRPSANSLPIPVLGAALLGTGQPGASGGVVLTLQGMTLQFSLTAEAMGGLTDSLEDMALEARMLSLSRTLQ